MSFQRAELGSYQLRPEPEHPVQLLTLVSEETEASHGTCGTGTLGLGGFSQTLSSDSSEHVSQLMALMDMAGESLGTDTPIPCCGAG